MKRTKPSTGSLYKIGMPILRSRARYYAMRTGHELDELLSLADELFMRAVHAWDPERGQFQTFLHVVVGRGLASFIQRNKPWRTARDYTKEELLDLDSRHAAWNPIRMTIWNEIVSSLSLEAQQVLKDVLMGPNEDKGSMTPRQVRGALVKQLRKAGWPWKHIWRTFAELREATAKTEYETRCL